MMLFVDDNLRNLRLRLNWGTLMLMSKRAKVKNYLNKLLFTIISVILVVDEHLFKPT